MSPILDVNERNRDLSVAVAVQCNRELLLRYSYDIRYFICACLDQNREKSFSLFSSKKDNLTLPLFFDVKKTKLFEIVSKFPLIKYNSPQ